MSSSKLLDTFSEPLYLWSSISKRLTDNHDKDTKDPYKLMSSIVNFQVYYVHRPPSSLDIDINIPCDLNQTIYPGLTLEESIQLRYESNLPFYTKEFYNVRKLINNQNSIIDNFDVLMKTINPWDNYKVCSSVNNQSNFINTSCSNLKETINYSSKSDKKELRSIIDSSSNQRYNISNTDTYDLSNSWVLL